MFIIPGTHANDLFKGFGKVAAALEAAQAGNLGHGETPLGQQPRLLLIRQEITYSLGLW